MFYSESYLRKIKSICCKIYNLNYLFYFNLYRFLHPYQQPTLILFNLSYNH